MDCMENIHPSFYIIRMGACIAGKTPSGHTVAMVNFRVGRYEVGIGVVFPGVRCEALFGLSYRIRKMIGRQ